MSSNPLTPEFNQFFIELAANNHKDWFDLNRKRYETNIKKPFEEFTSLLIDEVNNIHSEIKPEPKKCIFRINRDIRFSKDKTPYKLNRSLAIGKEGRKDMSPKGLYVELGPEHIRVYRGLYQLERTEVEKVRTYIAKHSTALKKIYKDPTFIKYFGEIRGEKAKRLSKELKPLAEKEELIFNKQWYYFSQMPATLVTSEELISEIMKRYLAGEKLAAFLEKALH
jgi:uncharacterized protein (TIGR02453 family)